MAGVLVLLFAYYRGFSYLRIFDAFITLVGIINTIVGQLVVFFVVLFYAYFMVAMLMVRLDNTDNLNLRFQEVYYWVFLGSVEGEAFDIEFSYVAIVVGSLFLTIVMLNILIAYLSNLFSRLGDQQKVNTLRQKALLILDFEMFARLFRFHVYGIPKLAERFDDLFTEYSLSNRELQLTEVTLFYTPFNYFVCIINNNQSTSQQRKYIRSSHTSKQPNTALSSGRPTARNSRKKRKTFTKKSKTSKKQAKNCLVWSS